jgi:Zn-dependent protease with chaperone function
MLTCFTKLKRAWDFAYGTFRIRRMLLSFLAALSVIVGLFLLSMPVWLRIEFAYLYAGTASVVSFFMYGAFKGAFKSVIFSTLLRRKYKVKEFTAEQYATFGVTQIINTMRIKKKVRVFLTENPWINGPFTNGFTNSIYIPSSWMKKFPAVQEMRTVLGHELGHIKTRGRFLTELIVMTGIVECLTLLLGLFAIRLVAEIFGLSLFFLLLTNILWRNERRADLEGAKITSPEGLISVFEQLLAESRGDDGTETHPPLRDRIMRVSKLLTYNGMTGI